MIEMIKEIKQKKLYMNDNSGNPSLEKFGKNYVVAVSGGIEDIAFKDKSNLMAVTASFFTLIIPEKLMKDIDNDTDLNQIEKENILADFNATYELTFQGDEDFILKFKAEEISSDDLDPCVFILEPYYREALGSAFRKAGLEIPTLPYRFSEKGIINLL